MTTRRIRQIVSKRRKRRCEEKGDDDDKDNLTVPSYATALEVLQTLIHCLQNYDVTSNA